MLNFRLEQNEAAEWVHKLVFPLKIFTKFRRRLTIFYLNHIEARRILHSLGPKVSRSVAERQSQTLQHGEKLDWRLDQRSRNASIIVGIQWLVLSADSAGKTGVRVAKPILENKKFL